jgi:nitrous oxide reductase accessory protein NosL
MNKNVLALILLSALAAACHERRKDAPPDYDAVRARSEAAHGALEQEGAK